MSDLQTVMLERPTGEPPRYQNEKPMPPSMRCGRMGIANGDPIKSPEHAVTRQLPPAVVKHAYTGMLDGQGVFNLPLNGIEVSDQMPDARPLDPLAGYLVPHKFFAQYRAEQFGQEVALLRMNIRMRALPVTLPTAATETIPTKDSGGNVIPSGGFVTAIGDMLGMTCALVAGMNLRTRDPLLDNNGWALRPLCGPGMFSGGYYATPRQAWIDPQAESPPLNQGGMLSYSPLASPFRQSRIGVGEGSEHTTCVLNGVTVRGPREELIVFEHFPAGSLYGQFPIGGTEKRVPYEMAPAALRLLYGNSLDFAIAIHPRYVQQMWAAALLRAEGAGAVNPANEALKTWPLIPLSVSVHTTWWLTQSRELWTDERTLIERQG